LNNYCQRSWIFWTPHGNTLFAVVCWDLGFPRFWELVYLPDSENVPMFSGSYGWWFWNPRLNLSNLNKSSNCQVICIPTKPVHLFHINIYGSQSGSDSLVWKRFSLRGRCTPLSPSSSFSQKLTSFFLPSFLSFSDLVSVGLSFGLFLP
jgi:hypothetical protein